MVVGDFAAVFYGEPRLTLDTATFISPEDIVLFPTGSGSTIESTGAQHGR
jgi:hypothetical protein